MFRRCARCLHTSIPSSASSPTKRGAREAARDAARASRLLVRGAGPFALPPAGPFADRAPPLLPARLLGFTLRPLTIALVGLPNVGKSSLFNRLVRSRLAIVNSAPGTTRDWKEAPGQLGELRLTVLDTGGLEGRTGAARSAAAAAAAPLEARMLQHTEAALRGADVVLYVIDARAGVRGDDERFVRWVKARRGGGGAAAARSVLLVANKAEGMAAEGAAAAELTERAHCLGLGEPILMSADHGEGLGALYAALEPFALQKEGGVEGARAPPPLVPAPAPASAPAAGVTATVAARLARSASGSIHLAVVGRPNVGKSTLVNQLLGAPRSLVGPQPGLTRDAVEGVLPLPGGGALRLVDTAGMRRAGALDFSTPLEGLAAGQARRALALANIVALVVDGSGGAAAGLSEAPMAFCGELQRALTRRGGASGSLLGAPADVVAAAATKAAGAAGAAPAAAFVPRSSRAARAPGPEGRVFALTRQDLTIAAQVIEEGRGLVVVVNKVDAAGGAVAAGVVRVARAQLDRLPHAKGAAVVPVSALRGAGCGELLPAITATYAAWCKRVPTGTLNAWLSLLTRRSPPPAIPRSVRRGGGAVGRRARGRRAAAGGGGGGGGGSGDGDAFAAAAPLPLRVKYITQVNARPPTFAAFVNHAARFPETYKRFLVNSLREEFGLWGVPVRLLLRARENPYAKRAPAAALGGARAAPAAKAAGRGAPARARTRLTRGAAGRGRARGARKDAVKGRASRR